MNKKLFVLLPIALLTLVGCSKNKDNTDDPSGSDAPVSTETIVMDFTQTSWKDEKVFPYIETGSTEVLSFDWNGYTFNDCGCFAGSYDGNSYMMMKNKDTTAMAFISNKTKFSAPITKIEVVVADSSSASGKVLVGLGGSEFAAASESPAVKQEKQGQGVVLTVEAEKSADYHYFELVNTAQGTKKYNAQINSVSIYFE